MLPQFHAENLAHVLNICKNWAVLVRLCGYAFQHGLYVHRSLEKQLFKILVEIRGLHKHRYLICRISPSLQHESRNNILANHVKCGKVHHAVKIYGEIKNACVSTSGHTFVEILKACIQLKDFKTGFQVHRDLCLLGLPDEDLFVGSILVDMYSKIGLIDAAQKVFDMLPTHDVVLWTALMGGYAEHGHGEKALTCFEEMQRESIIPNGITYIYSLKACGLLGVTDKGLKIHLDIEKKGLSETDIFVGSSLVDMYAKMGLPFMSEKVFSKLPVKNVISWNGLMSGYLVQGYAEQALECFKRMQHEGICPDSVSYIFILKACASIGTLSGGQEIHTEIEMKGSVQSEIVLGNTLIDMYAKCGQLVEAQKVFDMLHSKDVVSWTTLIGGYVEHGEVEEAIKCFQQMKVVGISPNSVTYICILKACAIIEAIDKVEELHPEIERCGILRKDLSIGNALVGMYAKCGSLLKAKDVFNRLPVRSILTWNALIAGYSEKGQGLQTLEVFQKLQCEGLSPTSITYLYALKACVSIGDPEMGEQLHSEIEAKGLMDGDLDVANALIDMYAKCGWLNIAEDVFDKVILKDVVTWTSLISGYVEHGEYKNAMVYIEKMQKQVFSLDIVILVCGLKTCAAIGDTHKGEEIYVEVEKRGLANNDVNMISTLIDMYAKCCSFLEAQYVFEKLGISNVVSWNALLAGYVEHGHSKSALKLFNEMRLQGVPADPVTLLCILRACSSLKASESGTEIHAEVERLGLLENDILIGNALLDMYTKCGLLNIACEVFNELPLRNAISWTNLIAGYVQHGYVKDALKCFEEMGFEDLRPESSTFVAMLKATCIIGAIEKAIEIHSEIEKEGLLEGDFVASTLIDVYGKFSLLGKAQEVFDKLLFHDLASWNALIAGYTEYGNSEEAITYFEKMQAENICPDTVTFRSVLKACGNVGALGKGQEIHGDIERRGFLQRDTSIGSFLIDMYAQCGSLSKAQKVFDKLPEQNPASWNSLIKAYAKEGSSENVLKCFKLMQMDGQCPSVSTLICSLQACSSIGAIGKGESLHLEIERLGLIEKHPLLGCMLVHMYAKFGLLSKAQEVFERLPDQCVVSWTALMVGYAELGDSEKVTHMFDQMLGEGIEPDPISFNVVLNAQMSLG